MTSDLQSLIHTNAMNAFRQGVQSERARIVQILEAHKLLPTYSRAASEFAEEMWENTKYRLIKEIAENKDE